jgi:hypothetical protein
MPTDSLFLWLVNVDTSRFPFLALTNQSLCGHPLTKHAICFALSPVCILCFLLVGNVALPPFPMLAAVTRGQWIQTTVPLPEFQCLMNKSASVERIKQLQ